MSLGVFPLQMLPKGWWIEVIQSGWVSRRNAIMARVSGSDRGVGPPYVMLAGDPATQPVVGQFSSRSTPRAFLRCRRPDRRGSSSG